MFREYLLLLGGNVGDPEANLQLAMDRLQATSGEIVSRSRDHWTMPEGFRDERLFLNIAVLLRSAIDPIQLLERLLRTEAELGRIRQGTVGPRSLDIDILLSGDLVMNDETLTLPHPRMHRRRFALSPSADIAPQWIHPVTGHTILKMLNDLPSDR